MRPSTCRLTRNSTALRCASRSSGGLESKTEYPAAVAASSMPWNMVATYNVCQSRHHDADGGGLAGTQAGRPQVRLVTEFLGNLTNSECGVGPTVGGLGADGGPATAVEMWTPAWSAISRNVGGRPLLRFDGSGVICVVAPGVRRS